MVDTNTVTHDENGKQNKSESDLKDALSVKEKNDDKEEKTINDPGTPRYTPVQPGTPYPPPCPDPFRRENIQGRLVKDAPYFEYK